MDTSISVDQAAVNLPPANNMGVYNPELLKTGVLPDVVPVLERWRLRDQLKEHGQAARLLGWGIDTIHYNVQLPDDVQLRMIADCEEMIDAGDLSVRRGAVNGYGYTISMPNGLTVLVNSGKLLSMGLWVMGGAGWCLASDYRDYEYHIDSAIRRFFGLVDAVGLSLRMRRVDIRFDFAGDGLTPWANLDNLISRAHRRRDVYGETVSEPQSLYGSVTRFTGATAGKSDIRCRLYDKVVEAEGSTLPRWRDQWGYEGDHVWRVEYQLRGDFLKEFEIQSMFDLTCRLGDLRGYLLDWFRFAEVQDRKDVERPLLPWWAAIVDSILAVDLLIRGVVRVPLARVANVDRLRSQALGLIASWAAAQNYNDGGGGRWSPGDVVHLVIDNLCAADSALAEKFSAKFTQYKMAANV